MSVSDTEIDSVSTGLAGEETGAERLARRLGDIVLTGMGTLAPNELVLAETALVDLLPYLPPALKRRFAERIAPLETAPGVLLRALLDEPFDVAEPILADGQGLTNCDLVRAADRGTAAHRLCIAGRLQVSRVVCDALVEKGEIAVFNRLLANTGADLSHASLELMVRRSSAEPDLIAALLRRAELTPWFAHMMFWWADGDERTTILKRFSIDRRAILEALADTIDLECLVGEGAAALQSTYRMLRQAHKTSDAEWEHLWGALGDEASQAALAEAADISPAAAAWIVSDEGGEPLAILGKALGLSRHAFRELAARVSAARISGAYTENELERAAALFDSVTMERADSILHLWDRIISSETQG